MRVATPQKKCCSRSNGRHACIISSFWPPRKTAFPSCYYSCCWCCLVTQSCLTLCYPMDCSLPGSSVHGDSPGKNTGVSCHPLLLVKLKPVAEFQPRKMGWSDYRQFKTWLLDTALSIFQISLFPLSQSLRVPMCLMEELQQSEGLPNMNWTFCEEEIKLLPYTTDMSGFICSHSMVQLIQINAKTTFPISTLSLLIWLLYPSLEQLQQS